MIDLGTGLIYRPEQAVELLVDMIGENAEQLGIQFVGTYDEDLLPRYPAVVVSSGQMEKEVHATHTFAIMLRCVIWVYHANITITHRERSLEDLLLVTALTSMLESEKTYPVDGVQRLMFGFVESEIPGVIAPRTGKGRAIVGTRMNWVGSTQQRWA